MTVATKTKKTKISELVPPVEIREDTKARRAWLAEKLAYVNSGFATTTGAKWEGKIVGAGSYQRISVYEITEVAGRLRHRGHCQFCGNSQVVDGGVMVLHGYSRPGIGYVFNECPCVGSAPLEASQKLTEDYLENARSIYASLSAKLEKAKKAQRSAMEKKYGASWDVEPEAYTERPHGPSRKATPEEVAAYQTAMKLWAEKFPLSAAVNETERRVSELTNSVWQTKQQVDHFETLLGWKLLGKALIEEVVV